MNVSWYIAIRFFFSKRKFGAINIISAVGLLSIIVMTAAVICVLSVMNGFESIIRDMCCQFDPPLKVIPKEGKYLTISDSLLNNIRSTEGISCVSQFIEDDALIRYKDFQAGARLLGVDDDFEQLTHIDDLITDGHYSVFDGAFERAVLGRGLANTIGTNAHFVGGISLFVPKRKGNLNIVNPTRSIIEQTVYISGTFAVNQARYDDEIMLISLPLSRKLFQVDNSTISYLGIKLSSSANEKIIKQQLQRLFNDAVIVQNQKEQQEDFYKMAQAEKLMTSLLLTFIILIASFNIISSLYMIILDKEDAIRILYNIGMSSIDIKKVFLYNGWLISIVGGSLGIIFGSLLCFLQQQYGWLKIGTGDNYVLSSYPVTVMFSDVIFTFVVVILIGLLMAYIPTRGIKKIDSYMCAS